MIFSSPFALAPDVEYEVTTFQAILPFVTWSSVEYVRARTNGLMYDVEPVIPKQTDFVTAAIAETRTKGSSCAQLDPDLNCASNWPGKVSSTP